MDTIKVQQKKNDTKKVQIGKGKIQDQTNGQNKWTQ